MVDTKNPAWPYVPHTLGNMVLSCLGSGGIHEGFFKLTVCSI